jgi:serine/threonine-protein kinase PRP4
LRLLLPGAQGQILTMIQTTRHRAGQKEAAILRKLQDADPSDKKHIVRLERTFEHRGHLCLVFESLRLAPRTLPSPFLSVVDPSYLA